MSQTIQACAAPKKIQKWSSLVWQPLRRVSWGMQTGIKTKIHVPEKNEPTPPENHQKIYKLKLEANGHQNRSEWVAACDGMLIL